MKDSILIFVIGVLIAIICYASLKLADIIIINAVTSSPVEEMYHRQLVNTIDSILDSRYPCGVIEDDSAYITIDSISNIAVPKNR